MMIVDDEHILFLSRFSCALILNLDLKILVDLLECEPRILELNGYFIDGEKNVVYKPYQIRRMKVIK